MEIQVEHIDELSNVTTALEALLAKGYNIILLQGDPVPEKLP
jgi:hypothetical protein